MSDAVAVGGRVENTTKVTLTGTVSVGMFVQADGTVASTGERALGVALESGVSGDKIAVQISGVARCLIGAAVTLGGPAMSDSAGKAIDRTSTNVVMGQFLTASTQAGDYVLVNLFAN